MSFLNAEEPSAVDLVVDFGIEVIWHPSLGMELGEHAQQILRDCASGARQVDIFVFEGTVLDGAQRLRPLRHVRRPPDEGLGGGDRAARPASSWRSATAPAGAASRRRRRTRPTRSACSTSRASTAASSGKDFTSQDGPAGDQHPRLPGPPGLDHPDRRRARGRPGRRHRARRAAAAQDVLHDVHPDRLHAGAVLRVQAVDDGLRRRAPAPAACSTSSAAAAR